MPNIQLNYMYRCGGNYKNRGEVIFGNPNGKSLELVEAVILAALNGGIASQSLAMTDMVWFYANEWGLPDLHFSKWDNELDVTWHEYEGIAFTTSPATDARTIDEFINSLAANTR